MTEWERRVCRIEEAYHYMNYMIDEDGDIFSRKDQKFSGNRVRKGNWQKVWRNQIHPRHHDALERHKTMMEHYDDTKVRVFSEGAL